jgi:hypothetical protein
VSVGSDLDWGVIAPWSPGGLLVWLSPLLVGLFGRSVERARA